MYNGILIEYNAGGSGDFFTCFLQACYAESKETQPIFKIDYNYDRGKSTTLETVEYKNFIEKVWLKLNAEQKKAYVNYFSPNTIPVFRPSVNDYLWYDVGKSNPQFRRYDPAEIKKAFNGDIKSILPIHPVWASDPDLQKENYFDLIKKVSNSEVKMYHILLNTKFAALWALYVMSACYIGANTLKDQFNIKLVENENKEGFVLQFDGIFDFNQYRVYDNMIFSKNKQKILKHINHIIDNEAWLKQQHINYGLKFEYINLDDLIKTRDFDKLFETFKQSYPISTPLSYVNKNIVNEIWDDRIERMKKLGLLDII